MLILRTTSLVSNDCVWRQPDKKTIGGKKVGARSMIKVSSKERKEEKKPQIKIKGWPDMGPAHQTTIPESKDHAGLPQPSLWGARAWALTILLR